MFFGDWLNVVIQRGRAEGLAHHRFLNLSCPLRGARGRGNGRDRSASPRNSRRHQGQTRGRTRRGSGTARSTVGARMGGVLAQLGGDEGLGVRARVDFENLLGGQHGEECASAIGVACAALRREAVQQDRGQGRVDAHRVLFQSPTRSSSGSSSAFPVWNQEARPGPERTPRARSIEASERVHENAESTTQRIVGQNVNRNRKRRRGGIEGMPHGGPDGSAMGWRCTVGRVFGTKKKTREFFKGGRHA